MWTCGGQFSFVVTIIAQVLVPSFLAAESHPQPLPGLAPVDRRMIVDVTQHPWTALSKVQTNTGNRCTGVLIGSRRVLTAAHCLYNRRTQRMLPASSLHVLFGYERGTYQTHVTVERYLTGPGYEGPASSESLGADWALLILSTLPDPLVKPLPIAAKPPIPGAAVALGGYNQDKAHMLMVDLDCHITGLRSVANAPIFMHDCSATHGTSGGPLMAMRDDRWEVLGINIAASAGSNIALSVITLPLTTQNKP
jgi:protease YdgD